MSIAGFIEVGRMDDLARLDTAAHRLDARAKAVATLAFIGIVMSFPSHMVSGLMPFFFYPVVLLAVGRIPPGYIVRKVLVAMPFALLIGIFNPLLDREPVAAVGPIIISGGWISFASIMLRFVLTVGAALALVACTGMYRLGAGLEQLGIPRVFVVQLLFLYRYLFVVADEGAKMMRAVELRSGGTRSPRFRVYASVIGHLLLRSLDRAERVYRAMMARGFDGEIRLLRGTTLHWTDYAFVIGWTAFFAVARVWNLADGFGKLVLGM